ncbi:MAG TPA: hypothetical protein VG123_30910, partial [Streptosporangiaceae bacterium]|nr:hypothetical protein [Streptosporangiaceae bacterium]
SRVLAVAVTAGAIPPLAARAAGGETPDPSPRLAALTPLATPFAVLGAAVAAGHVLVARAAALGPRCHPAGMATASSQAT